MILGTLIDAEGLAAHLGDGDWRIFDCRFDLTNTERGAKAYAMAHIPGAYYAHLDHDLSGTITPTKGRHPLPHPDTLSTWFGQHGISPETQVIAYDDSGGNMAVRLWWLLRWFGHRKVALLDGGWQAWEAMALPQETITPSKPRAVEFVGAPEWHDIVETEQIEQQLCDQRQHVQLLDVRTGERFRGEAEPIDPIAGHIPGAINLPLQMNLDAQGFFKDVATLRHIYLTVLGDTDPRQVALMCGSGVTACHSLLAMEIAGLHGAKLYAGSWSEWIRDTERPVATGS